MRPLRLSHNPLPAPFLESDIDSILTAGLLCFALALALFVGDDWAVGGAFVAAQVALIEDGITAFGFEDDALGRGVLVCVVQGLGFGGKGCLGEWGSERCGVVRECARRTR